jgi:hypothetical protein
MLLASLIARTAARDTAARKVSADE